MAKVKPVNDPDDQLVGYRLAKCPGCGLYHMYYTTKTKTHPTWEFNGDLEAPTFHPSMLVTVRGEEPRKCHFFLRNGNIQFLKDCTHELAGKTVPAGDVDDG